LTDLSDRAYDTPAVKKIQQEIEELRGREDSEEAEQLGKKFSSAVHAEQERLVGTISGDVDKRVVDMWRQRQSVSRKIYETGGYNDDDEAVESVAYKKEKYKALSAERSAINRKIYACMGQYPDKASAASDPQGVGYGYVQVKGKTMGVTVESFSDISTGLPALVNWLNAHGATDIRYSFR
jgi:hypothetical protein